VKIDSGSTAWMLASTALVLLMTPGLAFFYGGMTRAKSTLNMMMMSWVAIITVTLAWVLYGDSLSFAPGNGFIGGFKYLGEHGLVNDASRVAGIPDLVFSAFQLTFAVITVALISGAIADRTKFGAWAVFTVAWATLVYFPVAHWVWGGGWLSSLGIEDFAGGTVVHVNAGSAGLALALVLGKRRGWGKDPMRPHNLPLTLLGAGLLWFGWFGFNAGSELAADGTAALAFMNTQIATAAAAGGWLLMERYRDGKPTSLGVASGAVAGLVAITPACAFIAPWAAILLGLLAGAICCCAIGLKHKLGFDDSLDVVGVHLVGGAFGAISLGFLAAYPIMAGQRKGCSTVAASRSSACRCSARSRSASTPSPSRGSWARSSTRRWASGSPTRTRSPASTSRSTPRPPTISAPSTASTWRAAQPRTQRPSSRSQRRRVRR
jgi:Amt family ammonium transporter